MRASYRNAIHWIAHNDGAGDTFEMLEGEAVALLEDQISVLLIADIFGKSPEDVARAVYQVREREGLL